MKVFPRTAQGDRKRAFKGSWYSQHQWLEYSQSRDSAYCFACRHFSFPNAPETPFTSQGGYSNWKKALYKDGGFRLHEKSEGHVNAMFAWSEHKKNILRNSSVQDVLDKAYKKRWRKTAPTLKLLLKCCCLQPCKIFHKEDTMRQMHHKTKGTF